MMRVLIADDHSLFRDGIASLLDAEGFEIVSQVGNGDLVFEEVQRLKPDIVLLDIVMPGMDGIEALRQIKSHYPEIKVIMITASVDESNLLESMMAGADGYMMKSIQTEGLISGIKGVVRGEVALSRQSASIVIKNLVAHAHEPTKEAMVLTDREIELLKLVSEGLSNRAIAVNLSVSENTVKYHITKILQKLNFQNRTEAAAWAIRSGLFEINDDIDSKNE
jgi:DNA-binding NarL/FixJ family response regulator